MTWRSLYEDPYTTAAGATAALAIEQALPQDRWSTHVLAACAFIGGAVAADKKRRLDEEAAKKAAGEGKPDGV